MKRPIKYHKVWDGDEWIEIPMSYYEELAEARDIFFKEVYKALKIEEVANIIEGFIKRICK